MVVFGRRTNSWTDGRAMKIKGACFFIAGVLSHVLWGSLLLMSATLFLGVYLCARLIDKIEEKKK